MALRLSFERQRCHHLMTTLLQTVLVHFILISSCSAQTISSLSEASTITGPITSSQTAASSSALTTLSTATPSSNTSTDDSFTRLIIPSLLPPGVRGPPPPSLQEEKENSLLNVYFLLLALVVIVFAAGWWVVRRRKKEKMARSQNRGQNALARDVQNWSRQNRWVYSGWRGGRSTSRHSAQEGLDERGEAPPPYKPPTPPVEAQGTLSQDARSGGHGVAGGGAPAGETLAIPLRTLAPRHRDGDNPPEYEESFGSASIRSTDRPITAASMS